MGIPGVTVTVVEVNVYVEVLGCSVPGPLSRSGLDSSAAEDATANVTGAPELPEKVTDVPACTNALTAGLSEFSNTSTSASLSFAQINHGGAPSPNACAGRAGNVIARARAMSAT